MNTVLLIEDDAWLADLYSDVLQAAGYNVVHALDAQTGIEKLDERHVDVIVLDLLLPGHNGISLLHELRSYPDLAHIPVIIHSNIEPTQNGLRLEDWQAYGVAAYLTKATVRPQGLVRAVRRVIGKGNETV